MREVMLGLVEEHVSQAPAEDHAEDAVYQEVVDIVLGEPAAQPLSHAILPERDERDEAEDVHEPVPANRERAKTEEDGIELRVD